MQHVDGSFEANRIDGALGVPFVLLDDLDDPAAETLERLRRRWMLPGLRKKQLEANGLLHGRREARMVLPA